jgi:hypothetical protein
VNALSDQPPIRRSDLPENLRQKLDELEPRVQSNPAAIVIWERHLTAADRKTLGDDLYQAWKQYGRTAGMWAAARGGSKERAIAEVAYALDWLDSTAYRQLLDAVGGGPGEGRRPRWIADSGELWFDGELIRSVKHPAQAKNIVRILAAFEESRWPPRVDDPITSGGESDQRRRAIESLNKGLTRIRFSCTGDGLSFGWEELEPRS